MNTLTTAGRRRRIAKIIRKVMDSEIKELRAALICSRKWGPRTGERLGRGGDEMNPQTKKKL